MTFILLMMDVAELAITISDESTKTGDGIHCLKKCFTLFFDIVCQCLWEFVWDNLGDN